MRRRKAWCSEKQFADTFNASSVQPGPGCGGSGCRGSALGTPRAALRRRQGSGLGSSSSVSGTLCPQGPGSAPPLPAPLVTGMSHTRSRCGGENGAASVVVTEVGSPSGHRIISQTQPRLAPRRVPPGVWARTPSSACMARVGGAGGRQVDSCARSGEGAHEWRPTKSRRVQQWPQRRQRCAPRPLCCLSREPRPRQRGRWTRATLCVSSCLAWTRV